MVPISKPSSYIYIEKSFSGSLKGVVSLGISMSRWYHVVPYSIVPSKSDHVSKFQNASPGKKKKKEDMLPSSLLLAREK